MAYQSIAPYEQYFDADGSPLDDGYLFFGVENDNPETAPVTVYWDEAGTQPAAQPIRTLNGYPARAGTPASVYCNAAYSVTIRTRNRKLVAYRASQTTDLLRLSDPAQGASLVGYKLSATGAAGRMLALKLAEWSTITDFSTADKTGAADSRSAFVNADAFGQVIVPIGVYRIASNITIANRVWFMPGARLSIDAGVTVTFQGGVSAQDDQYIFGGAGNIAGLKRVTLNWFGAVGNGVANDTTSFTRAVASLAGVIEGVDGYDYRFASTIAIDYNVELYFKTCELILDTATGTASHFNIGAGTTQRSIVIDGGIYKRQNVATGGAAINLNYVGVVDIRNIRIYGESKIYRGIAASRAIICNIKDSYIQNTISNGIYAAGTGTGADRTVDLKVSRCRVENTGSDAISTYDYVEGVYIEDCIIYNITGSCFASNASSDAAGLVSFKLANTDFDTAVGGIYLNFVDSVSIDMPWISNIPGDGIRIDQCDSVSISGGQIYVTGANKAIRLGGGSATYCRNITIGGGVIISGGQDGIYLNAVCSHINIGHCIINGMTGNAVNKLLGPNHILIDGVMGSGNAAGISAGGTNLVLGSNNLI